MPYAVEILPAAVKVLGSLPKKHQKQIAARIDELMQNPRPPGVKVLRNADGLLRIRSGDYRIIYRVEDMRLKVLVIRIAHRREVYR